MSVGAVITSRPKAARLREWIRSSERLVIAVSGGVDSAVLLAFAVQELGQAALAVLAEGPSLPAHDAQDARLLVAQLGARFEIAESKEFDNPRYLRNGPDRCYWCRTSLVDLLRPIAAREGGAVMAYGAITDDLADDRPGMIAAEQGGVRAPLIECGIGKADVRAWAKEFGLSLWDKPASACLSSRIPRGVPIDIETLARVDRAERAIRALGFVQVRVRALTGSARVELDREGLNLVRDEQLRMQLEGAVRDQGFEQVKIDPQGYRPAGLRLPETDPAR